MQFATAIAVRFLGLILERLLGPSGVLITGLYRYRYPWREIEKELSPPVEILEAMVIGARCGAAMGPIPAEAWPKAGPQTGKGRSKPSSRSQALPVHPRERCSTQQGQQQLEGGIKAALQLLQHAGADLPNRPPLQRPLTADPSSEGIDQQLGADHHRQDLEDKALTVEWRLGRPGQWA